MSHDREGIGSDRTTAATNLDALEALASRGADALVRYAKATPDGCGAISSEWLDGKPRAVVLVATSANPERVALLHALHEAWYPEGEE